ncbi:MAG: pyridoxal-phosphate dependent enzyme [Planctomycetota bacterium]|jgi:threonine dehydratase/serine racemase|nr:MAG: pyridoxal-phosphate dependent enzyme [Planctomycetota bacterium]
MPTAKTAHYAANLDSIRAAQRRVDPFIRRTPVLTSATLDALSGRRLWFKCEVFQKTGSFKFRGATNAVRMLTDAEAARGVVTHSSGNHAQALALAARMRGIPAHVVMPSNSAEIKKAAVRGYGAEVIECEPTLEARESTAAQVIARTGGTMIPPFNHPNVIAGQGTIALELLDECPQLDAIIVPLGGGGLISGIALAAKALKPSIRIIGAEPELAGDGAASKREGSIQPAMKPVTMADGLRTSLGPLTFPVVRDLVDEIVLVSEADIAAHMQIVWERMKITIETSAAVGVAVACSAWMRERNNANMQDVGVVLCGGNVDLAALPF